MYTNKASIVVLTAALFFAYLSSPVLWSYVGAFPYQELAPFRTQVLTEAC